MKNFGKICLAVIVFTLCSCGSDYKPPVPAPLVNFQPTLRVQQQWNKSLTVGTKNQNLKLTPVIDNNRIYVNSYAGDVVAVDVQSGKIVWAINTKLNLTSGLAAGSGMVFAGSEDGQITAMQQKNGQVAWFNVMQGEIVAAPAVTNNIVLVKAKNGDLSAYNIDSGKLLWTYNREIPTLVLSGDSSAKVVDNLVVAGFSTGEIAVLNLNNGLLLWREFTAEPHGSFAVERMIDIDADPQIFGGVIYVVTYQGRISAIELKTGRILWGHDMSSVSGLAVDAQRVYVSDDQGYVWCFNRKTGDMLWKQEGLLNHGITAPALLDNVLVVGDAQGYVHFMAKDDGHFVARTSVGNGIIATPLIVGNAVYIYTMNGILAKFVVG